MCIKGEIEFFTLFFASLLTFSHYEVYYDEHAGQE